MLRVAGDEAAVGEHDVGADERVGEHALHAAEDPEPAAQVEPGDPDPRAAAGGDREALGVERVVDRAEARARADVATPSATVTAVHRPEVERRSPSVEECPAKQCPPLRAATGSPARAGEGDRRGDVGRDRAAHDRGGRASRKRASAGRRAVS